MLAGIVVGCLALLILLIALVLFVLGKRKAKKDAVAPLYEAVDGTTESFTNPVFKGANAVNDEMPDAMSNPFYGISATGDTYGSAGNYDAVGQDTYAEAGRMDSMSSNTALRVENGRMRLASVARVNPLAGESNTDDVDGLANPMCKRACLYGGLCMRDGLFACCLLLS